MEIRDAKTIYMVSYKRRITRPEGRELTGIYIDEDAIGLGGGRCYEPGSNRHHVMARDHQIWKEARGVRITLWKALAEGT